MVAPRVYWLVRLRSINFAVTLEHEYQLGHEIEHEHYYKVELS